MRCFLGVGAQELDGLFARLRAADRDKFLVRRFQLGDRALQHGKFAGDVATLALRQIRRLRIVGHRGMERVMRLHHPLFGIDAILFADAVDVREDQDPVLLDLVLHARERGDRDQAALVRLLRIGERGFLGDIGSRGHSREGDEQSAKGDQHLTRQRPVVEATKHFEIAP